MWQSVPCELTFPPLQNRFSGKQIKSEMKVKRDGGKTEENGRIVKRMGGDATVLTCDSFEGVSALNEGHLIM